MNKQPPPLPINALATALDFGQAVFQASPLRPRIEPATQATSNTVGLNPWD